MLYKDIFKLFVDVFFAFIALVILSPIMVLITLVLVYSNNGKPFFTQLRPGKTEKPFLLIKFKTMNDKKNDEGKLLPDKKRLTKIGRFIRTTSMDELPQLINVFKGDMSLIGPRPLLIKYLDRYTSLQARRHEVKPGITGWAQINGRNAISWEEKFKLDVWYVDHVSFKLDVLIFLKTIYKIFKREGISGQGSVTMTEFLGSNKK
jgi:lipopolysaccharide/colanic/teichoic acid biosynthesis glycosyltransferase